MNHLYLLVNIASLSVPFIFSFHPRLQFYKQWKYLGPALFITTLIFIPWDIYFTHIGVWGFNAEYLAGVYIYNLPLEELLFFVCIPYSCMFTHHCLKIIIKKDYFAGFETRFSTLLILFLVFAGIFNLERLYTSVTFFVLASLILYLKFVVKVSWLGRFYFTYLILLLPFSVVNGILTGTGLDKPIVWYNNMENMGIRLLSIPFEDIFYGMFLILLNVSIFEFLKKKHVA